MNKIFELLGLDKNIKINHGLLMKIIHQDMMLSTLPSLEKTVTRDFENEKSLTPMLNCIEENITQKHPLITHYIYTSIQKGFIKVNPLETLGENIIKTIHHTFVLEILVKAMSDDIAFMEEIMDYYFYKRQELNILSEKQVFNRFNYGFGTAKIMSIDKGMRDFLAIRKRGYFKDDEIQPCRQGISLNIIEAAITEKNNGYIYNSAVAYALAKKTFEASHVTDDTRILQLEFGADWVALYEAWNFTFIMGNLKHPQILFPKLFIPQVLGAAPNEYIFKRTLALWLSINFYIFAEIKNTNNISIHNNHELAQLWGKINSQYAKVN